MLAADHRLTDGTTFRHAVRTGRRAGSRTLVVHLSTDSTHLGPTPAPPRVGFVVSRAVGNAVVRNRVKRRLRHLVRELLPQLPAGCVLVVRALPPAASAPGPELAGDLARCLDRALEGADTARRGEDHR